MGDERRVHRVAGMIRGELARLVIEEISDPALKNVVITDVKLTSDLMLARVFFDSLSTESQPALPAKEIQKGLSRANSFLRRKLGEALKLRNVPTLEFHKDEHPAQVNRIYELLGQQSARSAGENFLGES